MSIANVSNGVAFNWFAGGKTEMSVKNNLEVVYGITTSVAMGMKSEFFFGHASEITLGTKVGVSRGPEFAIYEASESNSKACDSAHYMEAFTSSVGASPTQILLMEKLRRVTFILVDLQTALMISSAAMATNRLSKDPESKDLFSPSVGLTMTVLPQIATIGAALIGAVVAVKKKWGSLKETDTPGAAITLDADGGVFLGARKVGVDTRTAGVLVNQDGVQINAAKVDLQYNQPAKSESFIGFSQDADNGNNGGTRAEFANDGWTRLYGKGMHVALKASAGKAMNVALAEEHHLKVTGSGNLNPTGAGIGISNDGVLLKRDANTAISAQDGSINAIVGGGGGSALRLTPDSASLNSGLNFISVDNQGVYLHFGGNTFQINQVRISLCNNLTVLGGAAGAPFTGMADAIRDITALSTSQQASYTASTADHTTFDASRRLSKQSNEALITARASRRWALEKALWWS